MPTNIEIKARFDDLSKARRLAATVGSQKRAILLQTDTYFHVKHGRLKMREIRGDERRTELIWYQRANHATARASNYQLVPIDHPNELKLALTGALGVLQVVRKRRELWICKNVRIHLDRVEKLGNFIELEAVVGGRFTRAVSRRNLRHVQAALGIDDAMLVPVSYSDLLRRRR
jgi:predicted adenylyl cyclase CyaB